MDSNRPPAPGLGFRTASLLFGTAGIPLCSKESGTLEGIAQVRSLGLGAMELEFVHSVNVSKEKAPEVKKTAQENKVTLTAHGSYYINLNSPEKPKFHASISRVLQAARILHLCGGWSLVFHSGFYQKSTPQEAYARVKEGLKQITSNLKDEGIKIWIRPETTGKPSQFAGLPELVSLSSELEGVLPCLDFSHMHARTGGRVNKREEFESMLSLIEKNLGKEALKNMHMHLSGINYTDKGERNHLNFSECAMNYKGVMGALKEYKCAGVLISESPNIEGDAIIAKDYYESLK